LAAAYFQLFIICWNSLHPLGPFEVTCNDATAAVSHELCNSVFGSQVGMPGIQFLTGQSVFFRYAEKCTEQTGQEFFLQTAQQHKQFVCVVQAFNQGSSV